MSRLGDARRQFDVVAYREAVAGRARRTELASLGESPGGRDGRAHPGAPGLPGARSSQWSLSAMPSEPDAAIQRVLREIRIYRQGTQNLVGNLAAMVGIALLAQIDVLRWGHLPRLPVRLRRARRP